MGIEEWEEEGCAMWRQGELQGRMSGFEGG